MLQQNNNTKIEKHSWMLNNKASFILQNWPCPLDWPTGHAIDRGAGPILHLTDPVQRNGAGHTLKNKQEFRKIYFPERPRSIEKWKAVWVCVDPSDIMFGIVKHHKLWTPSWYFKRTPRSVFTKFIYTFLWPFSLFFQSIGKNALLTLQILRHSAWINSLTWYI